MARKRSATVSLADLKSREMEFEVITPDEDTLVFRMRSPSQSEMWDIERNIPEPQRDQFVNRDMPFNKDAEGNIIPVYDEKAFVVAQTERFQDIMYQKILVAWVDAEEVLGGDSVEEQIAELEQLGSWAISALWKITQSLVTTSVEAISARKFRRS